MAGRVGHASPSTSIPPSMTRTNCIRSAAVWFASRSRMIPRGAGALEPSGCVICPLFVSIPRPPAGSVIGVSASEEGQAPQRTEPRPTALIPIVAMPWAASCTRYQEEPALLVVCRAVTVDGHRPPERRRDPTGRIRLKKTSFVPWIPGVPSREPATGI